MYDAVNVRRITASENAASNGLLSTGVNSVVYIHKAVLVSDGSNVVTALVHDDINVSNAALVKIELHTEAGTGSVFTQLADVSFNPPVPFHKGLSSALTGDSAVLYLYYNVA